MHVTLINPPQVIAKSQVAANVVPPLGILYLAGYLNKFNIQTKVIDAVGDEPSQYTSYNGNILRGLTFKEIIKEIPQDTDLIGISSMLSLAYIVVKELIRLIKKEFPLKKIVLGGAHPTVLPEFTLNDSDTDIVVRGEGELTLLDLCRHLDDYCDIKGIAYKKNKKIFLNSERELIEDIDSLPFPDKGLVKLENYFRTAEPHGCSGLGRWTTILASRGCPYGCTFCTTPKIWRRRWRTRTVNNVIQEMIEVNRKHGIVDFHFEDDNLGFDRKWMHNFCDSLISKKLNFIWQPSNGLRVEILLEPGLLEKMKASGCSLVVFALESASRQVRNDIMKKNLDIAKIESAVSLARKAKIKSACYFVLGLPGERTEDARETVKYAARLARKGLDECVISLFSLLPGCELFNDLYKQGKVKLNDDFFKELAAIGDLGSSKSWSEHISKEELKRLRMYGYVKFMVVKSIFHPIKILESALNILKGTDKLKSERVIRTFLKRLLSFNLKK